MNIIYKKIIDIFKTFFHKHIHSWKIIDKKRIKSYSSPYNFPEYELIIECIICNKRKRYLLYIDENHKCITIPIKN